MRYVAAALMLALASTPAAAANCTAGLYQSTSGQDLVALAPLPDGGTRYLFVDGRRGKVEDAGSPIRCDGDPRWQPVPLAATETKFSSHGTSLSGMLLRPPGDAPRPLLLMVHGSERTSPRDSIYPYIFAALGFDVFHYDKRGTGRSGGEYTQNFELLADDAAAAMAEARRLDQGKFSRAGFFGGSQGGWVAPLAATRAPAEFVVVGFGLMASPIEEDREQVLSEMREMGFGAADFADAAKVAEATGKLVGSHFTTGFAEFEAVKQRYAAKPWFGRIKGEYTGAILAETPADLRRVGPALYDNLDLIWDYDATAALRRVKAPQLWILAEQDREAPPATSLDRLGELQREGRPVSLYSFPDTDHGMVEFRQSADGSRTVTRITDGYFRLIGDWVWQRPLGSYGRGRPR